MHHHAPESLTAASTPQAALEGDMRLFHTVESGAADVQYRTWEVMRPVVVVGHSTPVAEQVILEACRADGIPVLRRFTGGGAVVLGPGCLNYAIAVSLVSRPDLLAVADSFAAILTHLAAAIDVRGLAMSGGTDLALDGWKVSGNAQRRGRRALLHHGTLLYAFDRGLAARYLREPARQPAYRARRAHGDFMGNLPLGAADLRARVSAGLAALANAAPLAVHERVSGVARPPFSAPTLGPGRSCGCLPDDSREGLVERGCRR